MKSKLTSKAKKNSGNVLYFVNLFDIWLYRRQMKSHISFCIPSLIICYFGWRIRKSSLIHPYFWKREDLRDPLKGSWGLPSCHTLRTAALHEWCSLELYTSHPGDNKWQLSSPFPSPHPLFKLSLSGFVCFIYWSYWKIFVWKEGCVSKSIWNPPTQILGYWRSKDLGGDGGSLRCFPWASSRQREPLRLWGGAFGIMTQLFRDGGMSSWQVTVSAQENGIVWLERFNTASEWSSPAQGLI